MGQIRLKKINDAIGQPIKRRELRRDRCTPARDASAGEDDNSTFVLAPTEFLKGNDGAEIISGV